MTTTTRRRAGRPLLPGPRPGRRLRRRRRRCRRCELDRRTTDRLAAVRHLDGSITVFAAASLTDAFGEAADDFMAANPDVTVELNLAGSSALREQILAGAPSDVFASANTVEHGPGRRGRRRRRARGLRHATRSRSSCPAGNPGRTSTASTTSPTPTCSSACAPPRCRAASSAARCWPTPASPRRRTPTSPTCAACSTKVAAGELDAGLVYRSDVLAAGDDVEGIEIPDDDNVVAEYPIAALTESGNARGGRRLRRRSCSATTGRPSSRRGASPGVTGVGDGRGRRGRARRWALVPLAGARAWRSCSSRSWPCCSGRPGRRSATASTDPIVTEALRLSLRQRVRGHRPVAARSACRWRGCSPAPTFPGRSLVRALVILPMVLPPVVGGRVAAVRLRAPGPARRPGLRRHRLPAPVLDLGRDRRQHLRGHAVPGRHRRGRAARRPTAATRRPPPRSGPAGGPRSAGSPCRWPRPRSSPARCCAGRGRSASSAPRSPSPATSRAAPRRCRSRSSSRSSPTARRPSPCRWCSWRCPWPCWSRSATAGWRA